MMITLTLTPKQIEDLVRCLGGAEPLYRDLAELDGVARLMKKWTNDSANTCGVLAAEIVRQHNEQVSS